MDSELLSKFLSGRATEEEIARLRAEIAAEPDAVDSLFQAAELERDLVEVLGADRTAVEPNPRRWVLVSAAAVVLAAVTGYLALVRSAPVPVARVAQVQGKVLRGGAPVSAGEMLLAGEELETDAKGRVVLRFDDGTQVDLGPGSRARDFGAEGGKRMMLEQGSLTGDVRPQPPDQPLIVRTSEGEARVRGTRFTLSAGAGSSRLEVEKGLVRLTRLSDGKAADVAAGQMAVASAATAPVARSSIAAMAPGTWLALPETAMASVAVDPAKVPAAKGISGPSAVIGAWSGGAFDARRGRLVLWGGGYSDYSGNELYAFSLASMSWERLTEPTPRPRLNEEENDDGTPNARATYNGLAYVSHADRLYAVGGARAGNGFGCRIPWSFDFESKTWSKRPPSGPSGLGAAASYDPATRKLWCGDGTGMYSLDVDGDRWTRHSADEFYYHTGTIDTKRGLWIVVGSGKVYAIDVRGGAPVRQEWKTVGGDALVAKANPGVDYDPVRDRVVAWGGGPVYSLDPETRTWTVSDAPGAPSPTPNGIFGRWRYVPAADAFIVVTAIDRNVHFYKPGK